MKCGFIPDCDLALPTFYFFFLGLKKGVVMISLMLLIFAASTAHYAMQHGRLPWDRGFLALAMLTFLLILVMTMAYEAVEKQPVRARKARRIMNAVKRSE